MTFRPKLWMLLVLFLLMNLADLVTAWFILEGEANPLHILAGGPWLLYAAKIALILKAQ
jgi:hypothetical protein